MYSLGGRSVTYFFNLRRKLFISQPSPRERERRLRFVHVRRLLRKGIEGLINRMAGARSYFIQFRLLGGSANLTDFEHLKEAAESCDEIAELNAFFFKNSFYLRLCLLYLY